jgi:hypothetical protein
MVNLVENTLRKAITKYSLSNFSTDFTQHAVNDVDKICNQYNSMIMRNIDTIWQTLSTDF